LPVSFPSNSSELMLSLFFHRCILWSCHRWQAHLPVNMPTSFAKVKRRDFDPWWDNYEW
jgi:hypothetical protein